MSYKPFENPFNEEAWVREVLHEAIPSPLKVGTEALLERYVSAKKVNLAENVGKKVRLCIGDDFLDLWPFHTSLNGVFCSVKNSTENRIFFVVRGTVLTSSPYNELSSDEIDFAHFFMSGLTGAYNEDLIERNDNSFIATKDVVCEGGNLVVQIVAPAELEEECIENGVFAYGNTFPLDITDSNDETTEFLVSKTLVCMQNAISVLEVVQ
jgi:hypothetical protein